MARRGSGAHHLGRLARHALRDVMPRRGMPLRRRVSWAAAGAVASAVALSVLVAYGAVQERLHSELDGQLRSEATFTARYVRAEVDQGNYFPAYMAARGGSAPYRWIVTVDSAVRGGQGGPIPDARAVAAVASGEAPPHFADVTIAGTRVRVYAYPLAGITVSGMGAAIELGRPLTQSDDLLSGLRLILLVVFLFAVPLAAILGRFAARRVLRPLAEVTATADAIARTDDLSRRIEVREDDEVGQLARRFNAMLERLGASREKLDESVRSQRQLVADASHELRTPVTSLRTNVEVLLASPDLDDADRALLGDVLEQSEELSRLVADLIEVARGDPPADSFEDVRLDQLVEEALVRARRNAPATDYRETLEPVVLAGHPERLARAINNLLDNAAKHGGAGPVEVQVGVGGIRVRDHGRGIAPEDLPHVFDRFYRGVNSRSTQGSGLGLAIVRQIATGHGGTVRVANAPDGGAEFILTLPGAVAADETPAAEAGPADAADAPEPGRGSGPLWATAPIRTRGE